MTARATPSILSKGFIWFMSCSQRVAQKFKEFKSSRSSSVQSVKSVVKDKSLRTGSSQVLDGKARTIRFHGIQVTVSHHQRLGVTLQQVAYQRSQRPLLRFRPGVLRP